MPIPIPVGGTGSVLGYLAFAGMLIVMYWYWRDRRLARAKLAEYGPPLRALLANVHDPKYLGEAMGHMLCMNKLDAEGKPITAPADVLFGMIMAAEPQFMEHVKQMAPDLIRQYMAGGMDPSDPSELGRQLVARRGGKWASAARASKAAAGLAPKSAGGLGEILGALPQAMELIHSLKDMMPAGGTTSPQQPAYQSPPSGHPSNTWRPPV